MCTKGNQPLTGLKGAAKLIGKNYPDTDWHSINLVRSIQNRQACDIEIIEIFQGFLKQMKLRRQGVRTTPQFVIDGPLLPRIANRK